MTLIQSSLLIDFEFYVGLGPTYSARFLGVAYTTYCQYKRGSREIPLYIKRHIQTVRALPIDILNKELKLFALPRGK